MHMTVAAQRRPQLGGALGQRRCSDRLETAQVHRLLAAEAFEDRPLGDLPDAG